MVTEGRAANLRPRAGAEIGPASGPLTREQASERGQRAGGWGWLVGPVASNNLTLGRISPPAKPFLGTDGLITAVSAGLPVHGNCTFTL